MTIGAPILEPLEVGVRLAEELKLHLLKLADAEDEVAGSYFVAERLAYLADAERQLAAGRALNSGEVYEYTLRGLGTEINLARRVLGYALMGLEHQVELADIGEIRLAAAGAGDFIIADIGDQRLAVHSLDVYIGDVVVGHIPRPACRHGGASCRTCSRSAGH